MRIGVKNKTIGEGEQLQSPLGARPTVTKLGRATPNDGDERELLLYGVRSLSEKKGFLEFELNWGSLISAH